MVHRDLSPSNLMITEDDVVKLADFGLAKQRMGTNSVMESVVGTVLYQCPEIVQHESYSDKADIWSLGCILYQMASLKPPFEGGNPLVVANKIVEGSYTPHAAATRACARPAETRCTEGWHTGFCAALAPTVRPTAAGSPTTSRRCCAGPSRACSRPTRRNGRTSTR